MKHFTRSAAMAVVGTALLSMVGVARAQAPAADFPSKPVFLVVPFTPGGTTHNEAKFYTDKLHAEMRKAVFAPDVVSKMEPQGIATVGSTPEVFRAKVISELARIRKVIQERNIRPSEW